MPDTLLRARHAGTPRPAAGGTAPGTVGVYILDTQIVIQPSNSQKPSRDAILPISPTKSEWVRTLHHARAMKARNEPDQKHLRDDVMRVPLEELLNRCLEAGVVVFIILGCRALLG